MIERIMNNEYVENDDEETGLEEKLKIVLGEYYDGYLYGDMTKEELIYIIKKYKNNKVI